MQNLKVSIIEKVKLASGKWTNFPVKISQVQTEQQRLYCEDSHAGNFYLLWREGGQRRYHAGHLKDAIISKERKELYLTSVAR